MKSKMFIFLFAFLIYKKFLYGKLKSGQLVFVEWTKMEDYDEDCNIVFQHDFDTFYDYSPTQITSHLKSYVSSSVLESITKFFC